MFCRVCGFRVRVWEAYRTSRSVGYGYGSVAELTEVPGIVERAYRTHKSSGRLQNVLYPYPGYLWYESYRTHRNSGYWCESLTELTEVPGAGMKNLTELPEVPDIGTGVQNLQMVRAGMKMLCPYPGCLWYRRTELLEVPGTL